MKKVFLKGFVIATMMVCLGNASQRSEIEDFETINVGKYSFSGDSVYFSNPCYGNFPEIETETELMAVENIYITNGSMLNFSSKGIIGKTIRTASAFNDIPNPLGLTHSGIVVNENPKRVFETVLNLMPGGALYESSVSPLSEKAGKAIIRELLECHREVISAVSYPEVKASFSLESDGSAGEVLKGISPHVHIHDLGARIKDYEGNIFIRPLNERIESSRTIGFLNEYIGRPYESVSNLKELLGSVKNLNTKERVENIFCSELAAIFYKKMDILKDDIISNNVIPESFGSGAGSYDLLAGFAGDDVPLKVAFEMNDSENTTKTCCGGCLKGIFSCCGF